jgi:hypothetical protein
MSFMKGRERKTRGGFKVGSTNKSLIIALALARVRALITVKVKDAMPMFCKGRHHATLGQ